MNIPDLPWHNDVKEAIEHVNKWLDEGWTTTTADYIGTILKELIHQTQVRLMFERQAGETNKSRFDKEQAEIKSLTARVEELEHLNQVKDDRIKHLEKESKIMNHYTPEPSEVFQHHIVDRFNVLAEEVIRLRGEVEAAYQRGLTNGAYSR